MAQTSFSSRRAMGLCNLSHDARLDMIADGLPIILASAEGFWAGTEALRTADRHREAAVLEGFAVEEAAKSLILMDMVRCPRPRAAALCKTGVRTFYDHLGRLIYADAQAWCPTNIRELRGYVDEARKSHGLEGSVGEYIVPNWSRYFRESAMYADIEGHEDGSLTWNAPHVFKAAGLRGPPQALELARALMGIGLFGRRALTAINDIWSAVEFADREGPQDATRLTETLFARLEAEGLVPATATQGQAMLVLRRWQLPMYNLDFALLPVPLEELAAQREAALWAEAGYSPGDW